MIEGFDISHWQGLLTQSIVDKMKNLGIKFVYVKFSQGTGYKDPEAENSTILLQRNGIKVGAYHFVTTANGIDQYNWFIRCMGNFKFDLTPALDCEAYYSNYGVDAFGNEKEVRVIYEHRYDKIPLTTRIRSALSATWPTEATTDVIAMRLMGFQGFPVPAIYTSPYAGNTIFKSMSMRKYLLWIAHWGVTIPTMPTIWRGETPYIHQDKLVPADPYGITGSNNVDHDVWMNKILFPDIITYSESPSCSPTPSPSPSESIPDDVIPMSMTVDINGKLYIGTTILTPME